MAGAVMIRPDGTTIAASNFDKRSSFIGQKFSYWSYFEDALAKGFGLFFGVGTTSGLRGYYFAAPVYGDDRQVLGVVAVKIGLDAIEAEWRAQKAQVFVSDPEGMIFLSSQPNWLFQSMLPLTPQVQRKVLILALVDRISTIARHLRNVARKPDAELKDVPLAPAVDEALALLAPRLQHTAVQLYIPADLPAQRRACAPVTGAGQCAV